MPSRRTDAPTASMAHCLPGSVGDGTSIAFADRLPGVYLAVTGTSTTDQRDMAGLLYAGRGSILTAVAAEVDSREWHLSPGDWEPALRRHARLTAHGILVLHFTLRQVRTEPAQVVAAIRAALEAARADGQSRVRALPAIA